MRYAMVLYVCIYKIRTGQGIVKRPGRFYLLRPLHVPAGWFCAVLIQKLTCHES